MRIYKRIDRFLEHAIYQFADWIATSNWIGKKWDCVNLFANTFLLRSVSSEAAITDYGQVRIECGVPQTGFRRESDLPETGFQRPSAAKDLVIWRGPLDVAWDSSWEPVNIPWVVLEWKTHRFGRFDMSNEQKVFDKHDREWLTRFTEQNPTSFGYAVTVDFRGSKRNVHCAKFRNGVQWNKRRPAN